MKGVKDSRWYCGGNEVLEKRCELLKGRLNN